MVRFLCSSLLLGLGLPIILTLQAVNTKETCEFDVHSRENTYAHSTFLLWPRNFLLLASGLSIMLVLQVVNTKESGEFDVHIGENTYTHLTFLLFPRNFLCS